MINKSTSSSSNTDRTNDRSSALLASSPSPTNTKVSVEEDTATTGKIIIDRNHPSKDSIDHSDKILIKPGRASSTAATTSTASKMVSETSTSAPPAPPGSPGPMSSPRSTISSPRTPGGGRRKKSSGGGSKAILDSIDHAVDMDNPLANYNSPKPTHIRKKGSGRSKASPKKKSTSTTEKDGGEDKSKKSIVMKNGKMVVVNNDGEETTPASTTTKKETVKKSHVVKNVKPQTTVVSTQLASSQLAPTGS